ncbi:MAG: nickel-dependent lactate racemase [Clostridia bacterium]|nr:nickel-dependent lactate racemase [Clostridia bacterium]NCC44167.1 nickel-dependent lactate racemase [Clostridia bacterium]
MLRTIPWCEEKLGFEIPDGSFLWEATPRDLPGAEDEVAEILEALSHPIDSPTLEELVAEKAPQKAIGEKMVAVVVDDNTRVTPGEKLLVPMIRRLCAEGICLENITVIFALGSHRAMTEAEMRKKIGDWAYENVKTVNHGYDDPAMLKDLGHTSQGTKVVINRVFCEADIRLCIGNIIPQFIAGWSGGAKMIQPGISGKDTTAQVHLNGSLDWPKRLGNPENNIRHDMEEIARIAGLDFIVNTVLNLKNEIVKVVAGNLVTAHRKGVEYARKVYEIEIPKRADIVIAGTYPANKDMWQADKGLAAAVLMVKPQKTVIWCPPCTEGVSPEHPVLLEMRDKAPKEVYDMCMRDEIQDKVGASAHIMIGVMRSMAHVIVYSPGVTRAEAESMGFEYADSIEDAIASAFAKEGKAAKVGVLTHGADMAPVVAEERI